MTAAQLVSQLAARGLMVTTAESCTGGMVAAAITDVAGSSAVFDRGFVTYSNAAKTEMLGVSEELLRIHGAVSAEVATAMAEGALLHSAADIAVSVTGVAGPSGGSPEKPVGLVHFACARRGHPIILIEKRFGVIGRKAIRRQSVMVALGMIGAAT